MLVCLEGYDLLAIVKEHNRYQDKLWQLVTAICDDWDGLTPFEQLS
jgi:hypothetical protein